MIKKNYRLSLSTLLCLSVLVLSCSKMDDTYREFLGDGEIIYPARVESVQAYGGNKRIDLSMLLISDPKITRVKVFWNNGRDSAEKAVQRSAGVDTVRFSLANMEEGSYTFNIYTYDKEGRRSVKSDVIGNVYGDRYNSSLYNRSVKSATYTGNSNAQIIWFGPAAQMIGQHIRYTDSLGVVRNLMEPVYKADGVTVNDITVLPTFRKGGSFEFRTMFKPEVSAMDTFYSGFESRVVQ